MTRTQAEHNRATRERKRAERVRGENGRWYAPSCPPEKHGTLTGATYWMCQCDPCTGAIRTRQQERQVEREHNDRIIAQLAAEHASTLLAQGPPTPERGESATDTETGREQRGDDERPDVVDSQENVADASDVEVLVELPVADSPSPGSRIDGLSVPDMTPGARSYVRDVEHLRQVVHAYHEPEITASMPDDRERRIGHGVVLTIVDFALVVNVSDQERASGPSELLRDRRPARRYGKRGPSGTRNPTTWTELKERLVELGCRVEQGKTHVKVHLPDGRVTTLPSSASDWRALANQVSTLRSLGLDVRRPQ